MSQFRPLASALTAALILTLSACNQRTSRTGSLSPSPRPSLVPTLPLIVETLPPAPISGRSEAAAISAAGRVIIWGGNSAQGQLADGAIYHVARREWEEMAPAPIPGRSEHVYFWDGHRMLVWGGHTQQGLTELSDGAFYDPENNTGASSPQRLWRDGVIWPRRGPALIC